MIAEAQQAPVSVAYPPDNIVMEFDLLSITLSVDKKSADSINVKVNGKDNVQIVPDRIFACFSVPLALGMNEIDIRAMKQGAEVFNGSLHVFRRSDIIGTYMNPPDGFKKDHFHMRDNSQCTECHLLEPREYDKKPISPYSFTAETFDKQTVLNATSTCYSCHGKLTSYPYVHGPAAVWSCLSCHNEIAEIKYSVNKPDSEVCFGCHTEQKNEWQTRKYMHGPVTLGKCVICHSPHASRYPFNLYMNTWDLCVNCHAEKGSGRHVLGDSFTTEGHPTKDRPDPVRIGSELSCASCHSPHASDFPHLWAFEVQSMFELCQKCHNK